MCLQWHFVRLPSGVTRMSVDKQTTYFLNLLCSYLKANRGCLAAVREHDKVKPDKLLLGYYDDTYYYIRPEVFLPIVRAGAYRRIKLSARHIMEQLFAMNYIKVHWILTGEVRYRPQKRVGKTRRRYITLYRRQLEAYRNNLYRKEADDEQS